MTAVVVPPDGSCSRMLANMKSFRPPPIVTDEGPMAKRLRVVPVVTPMRESYADVVPTGQQQQQQNSPSGSSHLNSDVTSYYQQQGEMSNKVTPRASSLLLSATSSASSLAVKVGRWTKREDEALRATIDSEGVDDWAQVALVAFEGARTDAQCSERWEKVLKLGLRKGPWTPAEDDIVRTAVESGSCCSCAPSPGGSASPAASTIANPNWAEVARLLPGRLTKQVRERWQNHLDPSLVKSPWTEAEDYLLVSLQAVMGNRWNEIAKAFKGRSENAIKNRWNSKQRRRFLQPDNQNRLLPTSGGPHNFREALMTAFGSDEELESAAHFLAHWGAAAAQKKNFAALANNHQQQQQQLH